MNNFDLDFRPQDYSQNNEAQGFDLFQEYEEEPITIAVIEFGCALPFSSFIFMNAYIKNGKYQYKLEDEDQIHSYKIKHNQSEIPLTMRQVVENIDTAILMEEGSISYDEIPVGIIHSFLSKLFKSCDDMEKEIKSIHLFQ